MNNSKNYNNALGDIPFRNTPQEDSRFSRDTSLEGASFRNTRITRGLEETPGGSVLASQASSLRTFTKGDTPGGSVFTKGDTHRTNLSFGDNNNKTSDYFQGRGPLCDSRNDHSQSEYRNPNNRYTDYYKNDNRNMYFDPMRNTNDSSMLFMSSQDQRFKSYKRLNKIPWQKKFIKYKYHANDGKKLAAGGILFFEETTLGKGIWVILEEEDIYTDFGGKYDHNDGDIFATISREFREETYNTEEILYKDIKNLPDTHHVYIDGYDGQPVYLCVIVHMNQFQIKFDSDAIKIEREKIVEANPTIPEKWYKTLDAKFLLLKDICDGKYRLSNRLASILNTISNQKESKSTLNRFLYNEEIKTFFADFKLTDSN